MFFTGKGVKPNNIGIITPPHRCSHSIYRVLDTFAYTHAKIKANNKKDCHAELVSASM